MSGDRPIPVRGCWVRYRPQAGEEQLGVVRLTMQHEGGTRAQVDWLLPDRHQSKVSVSKLHCGFKLRMEVMESGGGTARPYLGMGNVIALRKIGDREQVLVDFPESGVRTWLPFENLRMIKGPRHRFITGIFGENDAAERFRLKALAYALEIWNENTGTLSQFDIDPLPHQIYLVHHILSSGNLNWLIADDVGLGKTIETGMLLAALRQRGRLSRVLLITPSGLTKQWKDELYYKFGFDNFEIYGDDFRVSESRQWKMHDFVIGSMDRLKQEGDLYSLLSAPEWDLVIVDEGHRLSRRQYGMRFEYSERFQLVQKLRKKTQSVILLTATPHQGMHDKFVALLELLRPERKGELETLSLNPEVIGEMVIRNFKSDVTTAAGEFVFKGKRVRSIRVQSGARALAFDSDLQRYLKLGYAAGNAAGGVAGRAIGFVMTIYRKLAASSAAAILSALRRRLIRIQAEEAARIDDAPGDERYFGEWEESQTSDGKEFFDGEVEVLTELIRKAEVLAQDDQKLKGFCETIVGQILLNSPNEKILVFTEYRATQEYLRSELSKRYGGERVDILNGSMDHDERRQSISHFEDAGQFLISTEAGGEGINLQRNCHIMVNYDLPWNPMRLVQRVGRLYRYGQSLPVIVFNLHAVGTVDEGIIQLMYQRIDAIVSDLATVGRHEFNERLADDVLGELVEMLDVGELLASANEMGIERTQQRIDEALERARDAAQKQRELFQYAAKYDPREMSGLQIDVHHLQAFSEGMFKKLGVEVTESLYGGKVLRLRLPDTMRDKLGVKAARMDVTFDRTTAVDRPGTKMMDLTAPLMKYLLKVAKSYDFGGMSAVLNGLGGESVLVALLRWQDDQGRRMRQSFNAFAIRDGAVDIDPEAFGTWLMAEARQGSAAIEKDRNEEMMKLAEEAANRQLESQSNRYLHPENLQWIAGAWIEAMIGE